ncbi:hypothetical protein BDZ97DRAFT_1649446 [Flammula alnicola]|nr:hypothetical protein BDZ97DRAFT_1649446 [Flammula alnicola]
MAEGLKEQIEKLNELHGRLQRVRQVPPMLLHMKKAENGADKVGEEFGVVKEIGDAMMSGPVQSALNRARESLEKDSGGIGTEVRRENRKRRRAASPELYVQEDRKGTSLLPSTLEEGITMERLGDWARAWNAGNRSKIRIRGRIIRLAMGDVMTVYMGIGIGRKGEVAVETIRAFGPREIVLGHGQSGYAVYQQVSQQLGKMLEQEGQVKLQTMVELVMAYQDLFVRRCDVCGRVVSNEGHVPCVVRIFDGKGWRAEHVGCVIGGAV